MKLLLSLNVLPHLFLAHAAISKASYPPRPNPASYVATGKGGAISSSHHLASESGLRVLEAGGNAMDAMIAASFVLNVVRPQSTSFGGGGFLLYLDHKGKVSAFDFRERAPQAVSHSTFYSGVSQKSHDTGQGLVISSPIRYGPLAGGVPGMIAGLVKSHCFAATIPLKDLLNDAIKYANDGFEIYSSLSSAISKASYLDDFAESKAVYFKNGRKLKTGDTLIQKELGQLLINITKDGAKAFYQGDYAKKFIETIQKYKGLMTLQDLANYRVRQVEPIQGTYKDYKIYTMGLPSAGGIAIIQSLNMLKLANPKGQPEDLTNVHMLGEIFRRIYYDRDKYLGDLEFTPSYVKGLLSPEHAKKWFETIDPKKATPSSSLGPQLTSSDEGGTAHITVVDRWGQVASSTQTVNGSMGSQLVAGGMMLNNEMADFSSSSSSPNKVEGGKAMLSSMSPTIVVDKEGKVVLSLGSPGGKRIATGNAQVVINRLVYDLPLPDAVQQFRIHHQYKPDEIELARGAPSALKGQLKSMGHSVDGSGSSSRVEAIGPAADGQWQAVCDYRSSVSGARALKE